MDLKDIAQRKVTKKIDELDDLLEDVLPRTDKQHREEIHQIVWRK